MSVFNSRWLGVPYTPRPEERTFLERAETQRDDELAVRVAVLDTRESERFFGVPLARRGIQPVWLEITNHGANPYRLRVASIDANYYPPLEAAYVNHLKIGRRLLEFGLLAWLFLPLIVLLPFKVFGARSANRRMNAFFVQQGIGWGLIRPGSQLSGFVFSSLDEGTKQICVRLQSAAGAKDFSFSIPIPGLKIDHHDKRLEALANSEDTVACDEGELRKRLAALPRSTTNHRGSVEGDPLNLAVVGDFAAIISGFGARWDETETISFKSCGRTIKAFLRGSRYRYSPVSALFVAGRSQDFALQKARQTINQRLHLRLWMTPLRFQGKPVWIGQVSRDIGVRFTLRTWNLTTHKIDPDVDDARDYVLDDLMESGRVARVGYVAGVEAALRTAPRHNLTGDSYFTDGLRAVAIFSETRTNPTLLNWM
ncbi:MAG: LssY C-terminal domain-containing protein [Planctomycetes bacterium]|nr:LssY C-terminal domain-containing protein [Planctomycetota bacterium]